MCVLCSGNVLCWSIKILVWVTSMFILQDSWWENGRWNMLEINQSCLTAVGSHGFYGLFHWDLACVCMFALTEKSADLLYFHISFCFHWLKTQNSDLSVFEQSPLRRLLGYTNKIWLNLIELKQKDTIVRLCFGVANAADCTKLTAIISQVSSKLSSLLMPGPSEPYKRSGLGAVNAPFHAGTWLGEPCRGPRKAMSNSRHIQFRR